MSNRTLVGTQPPERSAYHLDLRVLGQYLVLCETLNMSAAARRMGISTPAASQIVHRLERDLGVSLFERTASGLRLTPAGNVLRERARALAEAEDAALDELDPYRGRLIPTLRVYMMDSIAVHVVNALLPELMAAGTRLEVLSGRSLTRVRDFLAGEIDLLITIDSLDDIPTLEQHEVCRQGLVAVFPASVPEEERTPAALARRLPLIRFREGSVIDREVNTWLASQSLDPVRVIECGSPATMMQIVSGGHGWVMAPPLVMSWFNPHVEGLAWRALPSTPIASKLMLVAHADRLLDLPSVLARRCRAALRREVASWRGTPAEACIPAAVVAED